MSRPKVPEPVKLVASVFSQDLKLITAVLGEMTEKFGNVDFVSEVFPFEATSYYEREMGNGLIRRFFSFDKIIMPDKLPQIKHSTNEIEEVFSDDRRNRRVNIDPGYISLSHLILATGKGYSHRPYLRDGIYADLALLFREKSFHTLEWTYPDYSSKEIVGLMNIIRRKYVFQLKRIGESC